MCVLVRLANTSPNSANIEKIVQGNSLTLKINQIYLFIKYEEIRQTVTLFVSKN